MTQKPTVSALPNWWEREKQRRLSRVLLFLVLIISLIGYFYYISANGLTGFVSGVNFDTKNYIAFVRTDAAGHTALYAVKMDGTDLRRLTAASDTSMKAQPAWLLDGKSLLYSSNLEDSRVSQIYLLGSGQPTRLTYGTGNKSNPTVSPDGQHAAFISQGAVKSVYLNGKDVLQRMPQPRDTNEASDTGPVSSDLTGAFLSVGFSSDGTGVAGAQDVGDEPAGTAQYLGGVDMVASAIPPHGGPTYVVSKGREVSVDWEKTGERLACSYTESYDDETKGSAARTPGTQDWQEQGGSHKGLVLVSGIDIITFGQKEPEKRHLFQARGHSYEPKNIAWSPDGKLMAFECWRFTNDEKRSLSGLVLLKVEQANDSFGILVDPTHLDDIKFLVKSSAEGQPQNPKWSPDGSHLIYEVVKPDHKRDIWCINADGLNAINLTKGEGDNYDGAWSPAK